QRVPSESRPSTLYSEQHPKISLSTRRVCASTFFSATIACIAPCREALLDHAELHAPRFTDHVLVPRRVPNKLHIGFVHAIDRQNFALRIVRNRRAHSAAGRSQRHLYFHFCSAFWFIDQPAIVNQAKIDNVHRNFRIETLSKLVPDI